MPAVPTTPKGLKTREHILQAARAVFARSGFVAARMSDVAEEAQLSLGGLYRYFTNKENLFAELIADIHDELYQASRAPDYDLAAEPRAALYEANRGYLQHYYDNRDVMRAFIESATVETRFRDIWWQMRNRHIDRFVHALAKAQPDRDATDPDTRLAAEAMACLVEHSAYVWFAHEAMHDPVDIQAATATLTDTWYRTFFADSH
ncbi:MAG: TetR family transcriptional regulator [Streptosporangiales bacterium]|nr:TetR family transcriptional regulator [Streptosporangiales bacterium]